MLVTALVGVALWYTEREPPAPTFKSSELPDKPVSSAWLRDVTARIRAEEYVPRASHAAAPAPLQAVNRAHGLRTFFHPEGVEVVPRDG